VPSTLASASRCLGTILALGYGAPGLAAESRGPAKGTLIVDGGGATDAVRPRFVELCGGPGAPVVAIPTGASY
jgi:hypothetical protein